MTAQGWEDIRSPFDELVGAVFEEASPERAVVRLGVGPQHLQPGGIVHGGVYATLIEVAASRGAFAWLAGTALPVGISNHTDFLRPVGAGRLTAVATPLQRGRRLQLWQVSVTDDDDRLVAHGTVKLLNRSHAQE